MLGFLCIYIHCKINSGKCHILVKNFAVIIFRLYVAHESIYYLGIHIKFNIYVSYQEIKRRSGSRAEKKIEF